MERIVIKVGTALLSDKESMARDRINNLAEFIAHIRSKYHVILVSSGAIAAGFSVSKLDKTTLPKRQALAALGQPILMDIYRHCFQRFNILPAQLLLSAYDFDSRKRTTNAKNAIDVLLEHNFLPIINENDATATKEIVFGDNDRLSAHVTYFFDASLLVILSDIDGYYDKDPHKFLDAKLHKVVSNIQQEQLHTQATPNMEFATGGIVTKLQAAHFLMQRGKSMFLGNAFNLSCIADFLLDGKHESGTLFKAVKSNT